MSQNYATHRRWVPWYHFVLAGIILANVIWQGYQLVRAYSGERLVSTILAVGLVLLFLFARSFPVKVQDRVIRLEERLRLERLAPSDLKARISELTPEQLIALRFASDGELPGLARKVLDEKISGREDIKKLITSWRPDEVRA